MKAAHTRALAVLVLLVAGLAVSSRVRSALRAPSHAPAHGAESPTPSATAVSSADLVHLSADDRPARARGEPRSVAAILAALSGLYADTGALDWASAQALLERRRAAEQDLFARLAALGAGGARELEREYARADLRGKLLLARALGRIDDGEAPGVLKALASAEGNPNARREMLLALGQRSEPDAHATLVAVLKTDADPSDRVAAAQALAGRANALAQLAESMGSDPDPAVRLKAVASIGRIGGASARNALGEAARNQGLDEQLRLFTIHELGRSFGDGAVEVLGEILRDPAPAIRKAAVAAFGRLRSQSALAFLRAIAEQDPSPAIRGEAMRVLAARE